MSHFISHRVPSNGARASEPLRPPHPSPRLRLHLLLHPALHPPRDLPLNPLLLHPARLHALLEAGALAAAQADEAAEAPSLVLDAAFLAPGSRNRRRVAPAQLAAGVLVVEGGQRVELGLGQQVVV